MVTVLTTEVIPSCLTSSDAGSCCSLKQSASSIPREKSLAKVFTHGFPSKEGASSRTHPSVRHKAAAFLRRLKVRAPAERRPYCAFFGSYFFFSLLRCCCSLKSFCCSRAKR